MNWIIGILIVQTVWMVWRDLDARKWNYALKELQSSYHFNESALQGSIATLRHNILVLMAENELLRGKKPQ